jgi:MFS family permease
VVTVVTGRFGPVALAPGVTLMHVWSLMLASFVFIGFLTFVNIGQAYVLNEHLGIPPQKQGRISGSLAAWSEVVVLALIGGYGVVADRIGRRPIMVWALLAMAASYVLYPMVDSVSGLFVARTIYAVGIAAGIGMLATIINDYPQEISRGRLIAITGIANGLGVVFANLALGRLPEMFVENGFDSIVAGRYAHWVVAALLLPCAVVLARGLKPGTPARREARPPVRELIHAGIREGRHPRVALAYFSAFVSRSDFVVIGTFTVLWATVAGVGQGLSTADAVQRGSLLLVVVNGAAFLWMPVMGWLIDRLNRVTALAIGSVMAACAFLAMGPVDDPLDPAVLPLWALLGVGQVSCFFASQALIGQEARAEARGSIIGTFGLCGAAGILLTTFVGGRLFDDWMPAGPYVLIGVANATVVVVALRVRRSATDVP